MMKQNFFGLLMILLPMAAVADPVKIDGIYYNLIKKAGQAEVAKPPQPYTGDVVIPDTVVYENQAYRVTAIGNMAFAQCTQLKSVKIPNSVTTIDYMGFGECRNIKEIPLPDSLKTIGNMAFYHCAELESVSLPASLEYVGSYVFTNCNSLKAVYIKDLKAWCRLSWTGGSPLGAAHTLYVNGEEIKDLVIPEGTPVIGKAAFAGSNITSITIPGSVTSIEQHAFAYCKELTTVVLPNSIDSISSNCFENCSALQSVTIPASVRTIGKYAFSHCDAITEIIIPEGVATIGPCAFSDCTSLANISIPESVSEIGPNCFYQCSSLQTVPDLGSITAIGSFTFWGCTGLKSISLPDRIESIDMAAFSNCTGLTEIRIPDNVTTIESSVFNNCSNVTMISIGKGIKKIGYSAFGSIPELTDVYCYAEKVPETDPSAFNGSYIEYATLHVPESAVDAYKAVKPWSTFKNFYDPTGISNPVSGSDVQSPIYDLRGHQLKSVPKNGLYIQNGRKRYHTKARVR